MVAVPDMRHVAWRRAGSGFSVVRRQRKWCHADKGSTAVLACRSPGVVSEAGPAGASADIVCSARWTAVVQGALGMITWQVING